MSYKLFPVTNSGDQLRLIFDCIEEKSAFESAILKLSNQAKIFRALVEEANGEPPLGMQVHIPDIATFGSSGRMWTLSYNSESMFTTLECEIIREKVDAVRDIMGFHVFNFGHKAFNFGQYKPMEAKR
jgi:hypothetical protein